MSFDTRQLILKTAVEVFSESGYHRTKMDDIAREAGLAKGTIYYHFSGKAELFAELVTEGIELILHSVRSNIGENENAVPKLKQLIQASIEVHLEYDSLAAILFNELSSGIDEEAAELIRVARRQYSDFICRQLREGMERKEFKAISPQVAASALMGMIDGVLDLHFRNDRTSIPPEEMVASVTSLFLDGLLRRSA